MEFTLKRFAFKENYTIGRLCCDGNYVCDTLEPRSRGTSNGMPESMIKAAKKKGITAIPTGTYKIAMRLSHKFMVFLPYITGIKCYNGVMIHPGNYPEDTSGCVLPGWNRRKGMVCGSKSAMAQVLVLISNAIEKKETVTITISEKRSEVLKE